jgi:hypothetical protein
VGASRFTGTFSKTRRQSTTATTTGLVVRPPSTPVDPHRGLRATKPAKVARTFLSALDHAGRQECLPHTDTLRPRPRPRPRDRRVATGVDRSRCVSRVARTFLSAHVCAGRNACPTLRAPSQRLAGHTAQRRDGDGSPYPSTRCTVSFRRPGRADARPSRGWRYRQRRVNEKAARWSTPPVLRSLGEVRSPAVAFSFRL